LSKRSTCGVNGNGDLVMADIGLGDFREFYEGADCDGIIND